MKENPFLIGAAPGEFWERVESASLELIRKNQIACSELTEKQIASALTQALACGDFIKQIRVDNNAQAIIYIPFEREQALEGRIAELQSILAQFRYEVARLKLAKPPFPFEALDYFLQDP